MNKESNESKTENVKEREISKTNGGIALLGIILGAVLSIAGMILGGSRGMGIMVVACLVLLVVFGVMVCGLKVLHPNEAAVYTLFGKYYGTIKNAGFYFINPFAVSYNPSAKSVIGEMVDTYMKSGHESTGSNGRNIDFHFDKKISTKTMTLSNRKQKVNDALGNPVIIGAVVIWKVVDPTKAVFNVENYNIYLSIQCDTIIRNNARLYPYDTMEEDTDEKTLRGSSQEIADKMKMELQERVEEAGIEIKEVRITHLAYAEEIAAAMLQKQQAVAIIAARQKIVEGAVGMVRMALEQLGEEEIVMLDEDRKAAMVSNLMVVLCGNKDAMPIINSGSIY
ncbi:MAG: SPFH domain-containing protein [Lachnospiraceae bacterium]|nr:SPFH domain-containing protein [Lachnospiraceae bacterium]